MKAQRDINASRTSELAEDLGAGAAADKVNGVVSQGQDYKDPINWVRDAILTINKYYN